MNRQKQNVRNAARTTRATVRTPPQASARSLSKGKSTGQAFLETIPVAAQVDAAIRRRTKHKSRGRKILNGVGAAASYLTKAGKIAASVAPVIAPFLLASHPPTRANALKAGVQVPQLGAGASPVAYGNPFRDTHGMQSMNMKPGRGGIRELRVTGVAKLRDITNRSALATTGAPFAEGELMARFDVNPSSSDWAETDIFDIATLFAKYKINKLVAVDVPALPTLDDGSRILSFNPDADAPYASIGLGGTQQVTARDDSETANSYEVAMTCANVDTKETYYSIASSEPRLASGGYIEMVCNASNTIAVDTNLSSMFVVYDYTFLQKRQDDSKKIQNWIGIAIGAGGQTTAVPFGTPSGPYGMNAAYATVSGVIQPLYDDAYTDANVVADFEPPLSKPNGSLTLVYSAAPASTTATFFNGPVASCAGFGTLSGFPVGMYLICVRGVGSNFNTSTQTSFGVVNAGVPYYQIAAGSPCAFTSFFSSWYVLLVTKYTLMPECGFVMSINTTSGTALTQYTMMITKIANQSPAAALSLTNALSMMTAKLDDLASKCKRLEADQTRVVSCAPPEAVAPAIGLWLSNEHALRLVRENSYIIVNSKDQDVPTDRAAIMYSRPFTGTATLPGRLCLIPIADARSGFDIDDRMANYAVARAIVDGPLAAPTYNYQ